MTTGSAHGSPLLSYGVAVAASMSVLLIVVLLRPFVDPNLFWALLVPLTLVGVVTSAWFGGWRGGLLATFFGVVANAFFALSSEDAATIARLDTPLWRGVFALLSLLMTALTAAASSAQRRAEVKTRELQASEERHRRILDTAYEGIWSVDSSGRIDYVNHRMTEMLGYPADELLGRHFCDLVHEADRAAAPVGRGFHPAPRHRDLRLRRKDGSVLWAIVSSTPVPDGLHPSSFIRHPSEGRAHADGRPSGQRSGALGMVTDVTERKQAEEALRGSEEQLRLVVNATNDAVRSWNIETNEVRWNEAVQKLFGYPLEEVLPTFEWWYGRIHPEDARKTLSELRGVVDGGGQSWSGEYRFRRADGSYVTVIDRGQIVRDERGSPTRLVGAMMDISQRVSLEEQLRQSQRLEAIGRLAGGVAHDFNNMLGVVTGYSEILLRRENLDPSTREPVEEIKKAGERAAALTHQLLAFSRKQLLEPQVLDLNEVVLSCDKMLRRLIGEDIEVVVLPGPLLRQVVADPGQVQQVILNLAVNARDAMPEGGQLTIEMKNREVDGPPPGRDPELLPGKYVMMAVSDTGSGMSAETVARIFEPFFTTKPDGEGTGLGLATVYGIVKQSGGHISVESQPGKGSTFRVYLPQAEGAPAAPATQVAEGPVDGTETVLLVEDESMIRGLVRTVLEGHGYTVLEAIQGDEALRVCELREGDIDLLVTDVVMPGMSGRELAERIAVLRPEIKTLFMSGYTDDAMIRHGVLGQRAAFMQKPFTPDAMLRKVREVLDTPARV